MKMLFDKVLIEEYKEPSGIEIVGETRSNIGKGIVKEVGPGQSYGLPRFEETIVKQGDVVYFYKETASKLKHENKEYILVSERECISIL